jgi:hypothetical protein
VIKGECVPSMLDLVKVVLQNQTNEKMEKHSCLYTLDTKTVFVRPGGWFQQKCTSLSLIPSHHSM